MIAQQAPAILPGRETGTTSPYPTVVIVIIANQIPSGILVICAVSFASKLKKNNFNTKLTENTYLNPENIQSNQM